MLVVGFAGEEADGVDAGLAVHLVDGSGAAGLFKSELLAHLLAGGIDEYLFAGFRVAPVYHADVRPSDFAFVADDHTDEIVAAGGDFQQLFIVVGKHEVANEKGDVFTVADVVEIVKRRRGVGAFSVGLVCEHFADEPQDVASALFRRNIFFHFLGKENQPDAIIVADGGKGQHGGDFRREVALHLLSATEQVRGTDIDHEHDGHFALFDKFFDVRRAGAGGDVPVDGADVVAGHIFAHLVELHPAPLEGGMVLPRKHVVHGVFGGDLDSSDFFQKFFVVDVAHRDNE